MNSENSRNSEYHVLLVKLADKLDLRRGQKHIALSDLSIHDTWKNIKISYNNNKFDTSAPIWSDEFELLDGSYLISASGRCGEISNLRRISNLLSFLSFRVFFEVQTLLSNMAANSNG